MTVIELKNVTKSYKGVNAVKEISFKVEKGEIFAVLGPSGSGKTTVLRLIAGLEAPDHGEIIINGQPVAGNGFFVPPEKRNVGMVFQDYALFPHLNVKKNIAFGLNSFNGTDRKGIVSRMFEFTELEGFEDRYPHQLSGGQQQRIALARALAPCPAALLLDEPFSNLDADLRAQMRSEMLSILRRAGTTAILVTHDQEEAFILADRIGVLNQGRLEQLGTPEDIYHRPRTPFVARFVGQADFLTAVVKDGQVETELGSFYVDAPIPHHRLRVMIRPDDIDFVIDDQGEATIVNREFLGSENLYNIRLGSGDMVRSSQPSTSIYPIDQKVHITANLDHVVVFPYDETEDDSGGKDADF